MKSKIAHTSKGDIEYTHLGAGPTVLVCHGTSSDCFSTEITPPLLDADLSVLTPSRPGYGRTQSTLGRSAAQSAGAIIQLLDELQVSTCSVIGISGGGPTGIALAANYPDRVKRFVLLAAISKPEGRENETNYQKQMAFYGPMHSLNWGMLGVMSRLSPRSMARQTLALFSTHDPDDSLSRLNPEDIKTISRFFQGHSSRQGALNDMTHTVGKEVLQAIHQPTLVIHSREDNSVPFSHAEWSLENIPQASLCEAGFTGHFFWIGPDFSAIKRRLVEFLHAV